MFEKFLRSLRNHVVKLYIKLTGSSLAQGENMAPEGESAATPGMGGLLSRAAAEGAVLLENDGVLPLKGKFALFGRTQVDSFYTGYGSGGDVVKPYRVSILDGILKEPALSPDAELVKTYQSWSKAHPVDHGFWGNWPLNYPEMPLTEEMVKSAAARAETAVIVIGRASGEDRDNLLEEGSYYLTQDERQMLTLAKKYFQKTAVLLNIGSVIDFAWIDDYRPNAVLILWQGGMEAGTAAAKLLSGAVNPSGKLTVCIPKTYKDYPAQNFGSAKYTEYTEDIFVGYRYFETFAKDKVRYPFGYGLSYTKFSLESALTYTQSGAEIKVKVKNIGGCAGKCAVQAYMQKPFGKGGNPKRELACFQKTSLLPAGGEEELTLAFPIYRLTTWDDETSSDVLLGGEFIFFVGEDVRSAKEVGRVKTEGRVLRYFGERGAPRVPFKVFRAEKKGEDYALTMAPVRLAKADLKAEMLSSIPPENLWEIHDNPCTFEDVKSGKVPLRAFVAQLSFDELEAISRGDYTMNSPLGPDGNAGAFGGVLPSLNQKGVPPVITTDGPSGIRLKAASSLLPIGTLLASTFDEALVEEVYAAVGREMKARGTDVLLAPGMNIQRSPLCGRNFEYYSEDPVVAGKIAAAAVKGLQGEGVSACPKHFACNNQEFNRSGHDARVSERALREIYLKGFEICVREANPHCLMTSYNKINGVWGHYQFDLVRGILRGEWGFGGCVITDWWMKSARCPEDRRLQDNAYRIRAGVNVLMPGGGHVGPKKPDGTVLKAYKKGALTLGELRRNAEEVLAFVLHSSAMDREGK